MSQTWDNETADIDGARMSTPTPSMTRASNLTTASSPRTTARAAGYHPAGERPRRVRDPRLRPTDGVRQGHWDTVDEFDASNRPGVRPRQQRPPIEAYRRTWSDANTASGSPKDLGHAARDIIRDWCADNEVEAVNIRVINSVPFRDLDQIPEPCWPT